MNKTATALFLTGVLAASAVVPAAAADHDFAPARPGLLIAANLTIAPQPSPVLADSLLYYGEILEVRTDEAGALTQLVMESPRDGKYVMNLTPNTAVVDSTARATLPLSSLAVGQRAYVFHSAAVTRSLPPQTAAFAVVVNLPMDVSCAKYREIEAVAQENGTYSLTSENGELTLLADSDTQVKAADGSAASLADLKAGTFVMAWYEGEGTVHADALLLLPDQTAPVTRAQLIAAVHKASGSPVVNYLMRFADVDQSAPEAEAIRWAASEKIMNGYTVTDFGADDEVTLEQAVTVLWRASHSPMLMDYPGLTQYTDAGDISRYAGQALVWAHQQGLLDKTATTLRPRHALTAAEASTLIDNWKAL